MLIRSIPFFLSCFLPVAAFAADIATSSHSLDSTTYKDSNNKPSRFFFDPQLGVRVRSYNHASVASIPKSHGFSLQARAGFRLFNWLMMGISPEYMLLEQFDKSGAFMGNWAGYEITLLKPLVGISAGDWQLVFAYDLNPHLYLGAKTATGQTLEYTNGVGYQAELDFLLDKSGYISLHYAFGKYNDQVLDGVASPLTFAVKWNEFGIGYTHMLF